MNPLAIFSVLRALWVWIVMGVLLAALGLQTVRLDHAQTEYAQLQAQIAEERQKAAEASQQAEQAVRDEEERREQLKEQILNEAEHQTEIAKAAADSANAAADGLRQRVAALVISARSGTANPGSSKGSAGKPSADPLDLLSGVLSRLDDTSGELAAYADRLLIAGQGCEAAYKSLTQ